MDDKNLRVKFSQGDVVTELEGDSSTVLSEFRSIKKEGVGKLVEFFGQVPTLQSPILRATPAPKDFTATPHSAQRHKGILATQRYYFERLAKERGRMDHCLWLLCLKWRQKRIY